MNRTTSYLITVLIISVSALRAFNQSGLEAPERIAIVREPVNLDYLQEQIIDSIIPRFHSTENSKKPRVLIRVCSSARTEIALAVSPVSIPSVLKHLSIFEYPEEKIVLARYSDCRIGKLNISGTEVWLILGDSKLLPISEAIEIQSLIVARVGVDTCIVRDSDQFACIFQQLKADAKKVAVIVSDSDRKSKKMEKRFLKFMEKRNIDSKRLLFVKQRRKCNFKGIKTKNCSNVSGLFVVSASAIEQ